MTKKRLVSTVILLGLVAVLGLLSLAQPVAPKGIIINPPDPTGLTVRVWVDKGAYAVGEKIQIHYEVNQDAYVYIYDIDADGKVSMLFPNYYSQNNYVAAGEHVLPDSPAYNLTVVEPTGTEYLQAIASAQPLNLAPQFQITIPFPFMGADPDALKIQIQGQIMGIVPDPQWSQDWTSFEVVSGAPSAYGALIINSAPSGAWITIDGHYAGYTPRTLYITQGYHQISLSKTGYEDWTRGLFVIGGQTRTINAALNPIAQVNQPPVAAFNFSPTNPLVGGWVQFNGSASSDPDGSIITGRIDQPAAGRRVQLLPDQPTGRRLGPVQWLRFLRPGWIDHKLRLELRGWRHWLWCKPLPSVRRSRSVHGHPHRHRR
jgi:hypothetical protein